MNICTILILIKINLKLDFGGEILAKFSHKNTFNKMHFISFEGEWRKSQIEVTTLKVKE
jgi:hypothetical protein